MAQGVYRNSLFTDADSKLGVAEGALHAAFGHRTQRLFSASSATAESREEQAGMAVGAPILA